MNSLPATLHVYRLSMTALSPLVPLLLARRRRRGKESAARLSERQGYAAIARPNGKLIWIHGASVGECLSVLPLVEALVLEPNRTVLVTSGTVTSAQLMAERLPPRAIHQFVPVDTPSAVARFLDRWKPDIGLFVDSEIWPNLLLAAHARGVPLGLINGRMSLKSFAGWRKFRRTAHALLSLYDICLVQDDETAMRLSTLGARNVEVAGSLKADAADLPADEAELAKLAEIIGERPVLLAASIHPGEEQIVLAAHDILRRNIPELLTILVPRHPERGADLASACGTRVYRRRALGGEPEKSVDVYVADTLGELGLFYRLASFAFIGKSLVAGGGQNPLEAARLAKPVIAGPATDNFRAAYDALFAAQGAGRVASASELAALAERLLRHPEQTREIGKASQAALPSLGGAIARTRVAVEAML